MPIVSANDGKFWNGEELFFCMTCKAQLPKHFMHDADHDIIPLEWVKFCGSCNSVVEDGWSFCPVCGQKFGDW